MNQKIKKLIDECAEKAAAAKTAGSPLDEAIYRSRLFGMVQALSATTPNSQAHHYACDAFEQILE